VPSSAVIGSLSHLKTRGTADYADAITRTIANLSTRVGGGAEVVPLVLLPLAGVGEPHLIRAMLDIDGWLLSGANGIAAFPKTREFFWELVAESNKEGGGGGGGGFAEAFAAFALMMPIFLKNQRKVPYLLEPPTGLAFKKIPPISAFDLAAPGWAPGRDSCQNLAECLTRLKLNSKDTVVLDIWSNSSVMGTDEFGLPCRAVKQHGTYHIVGHLQAAPRTVFQKGMDDS
jgi:hypothetical protein